MLSTTRWAPIGSLEQKDSSLVADISWWGLTHLPSDRHTSSSMAGRCAGHLVEQDGFEVAEKIHQRRDILSFVFLLATFASFALKRALNSGSNSSNIKRAAHRPWRIINVGELMIIILRGALPHLCLSQDVEEETHVKWAKVNLKARALNWETFQIFLHLVDHWRKRLHLFLADVQNTTQSGKMRLDSYVWNSLFFCNPLGVWDPPVAAPGQKYSEVPGKGDEGREDDESHHCVDQVEDHQVHPIRGDGALVPVALNIAGKKRKRSYRMYWAKTREVRCEND